MSEVRLGQLINGPSPEKDAIHVAVARVEAGNKLWPGVEIGFMEDGRVSDEAAIKIGVVDPFLKNAVFPGDVFWLVMFPQTAKNLRHDWDHPDFPERNNKEVEKLNTEKGIMKDEICNLTSQVTELQDKVTALIR